MDSEAQNLIDRLTEACKDLKCARVRLAMLISEVVMQFCGSPLEAVAILGQAVTFIAADEADRDEWVIQ